MGVSLNYKLGQKLNCVKSTLDHAQAIAQAYKTEQADKLGISVTIRRENANSLLIDIGNCETLSFCFRTVREINEASKLGWDYAHATLTDYGRTQLNEGHEIGKYPQNETAYTAGLCKTQFAHSLAEHKWVAEIIRAVASRCFMAHVNDEGDYYHSGDINEAGEAIHENGQLIGLIGKQLAGLGYKESDMIKGETVIKPLKK